MAKPFFEQLVRGLERTKHGVSDLTEIAVLRRRISGHEREQQRIFETIGRKIYELSKKGKAIPAVEAWCLQIQDLDEAIADENAAIAKVETRRANRKARAAAEQGDDEAHEVEDAVDDDDDDLAAEPEDAVDDQPDEPPTPPKPPTSKRPARARPPASRKRPVTVDGESDDQS